MLLLHLIIPLASRQEYVTGVLLVTEALAGKQVPGKPQDKIPDDYTSPKSITFPATAKTICKITCASKTLRIYLQEITCALWHQQETSFRQ